MIDPVNQNDINNLKNSLIDPTVLKMLNDSYESIVLNQENKRLNLDYFIKNYYPLFRYFLHKGEDKLQERYKYTCLTAEWITFAEGPYREVDLFIRVDGKEKVEFTLPSIFATPVIEGGTIDGLSQELENFKNKLERLPQEGDKYFQHRIAPLRERFKDLSSNHRQKWITVLDNIKFKYKLPDIPDIDGDKKTTTNKVEEESLEDLGFE